MGIKDLVDEYIEGSRKPKWRILKEHEEEIRYMLDNNIPLRKQVEIILEAGILKKLFYKEYVDILKKHFGYTGRNNQPRKFETKEERERKRKERKIKGYKDPVEMLSQSVDLI